MKKTVVRKSFLITIEKELILLITKELLEKIWTYVGSVNVTGNTSGMIIVESSYLTKKPLSMCRAQAIDNYKILI